jgi:hypothetical protein
VRATPTLISLVVVVTHDGSRVFVSGLRAELRKRLEWVVEEVEERRQWKFLKPRRRALVGLR